MPSNTTLDYLSMFGHPLQPTPEQLHDRTVEANPVPKDSSNPHPRRSSPTVHRSPTRTRTVIHTRNRCPPDPFLRSHDHHVLDPCPRVRRGHGTTHRSLCAEPAHNHTAAQPFPPPTPIPALVDQSLAFPPQQCRPRATRVPRTISDRITGTGTGTGTIRNKVADRREGSTDDRQAQFTPYDRRRPRQGLDSLPGGALGRSRKGLENHRLPTAEPSTWCRSTHRRTSTSHTHDHHKPHHRGHPSTPLLVPHRSDRTITALCASPTRKDNRPPRDHPTPPPTCWIRRWQPAPQPASREQPHLQCPLRGAS